MRAVVVAAGGAVWEAGVLDDIGRSPGLRLHRRCLDVAELLALSGHSDVAVVATDLAGLDLDAVRALQRDGVHVIGVGPAELGRHVGIVTIAAPADVVTHLDGPPAEPAPASTGRVVAVWGPHGAPGRSVVAASIASAWAASGSAVALADADGRGGALAQMFAVLDEASGLVAACRSANRGDVAGIADAAVVVEPRLRLLTGVARADMWDQVRPAPFELVLRTMAHANDIVVVDLGPGLDAHTAHVLKTADRVVTVGRADPVGLARLIRAVHDLADVRGPAVTPPTVVLNLLRATAAWTQREVSDAVERLAGHRPDVFVPADFKTLDTAALRGKTPAQVAAASPFAAAMSDVVRAVQIEQPAPVR